MATDDQNVWIQGVEGVGPLYAWANESTQKKMEGTLKQIAHDGNMMMQFIRLTAEHGKVTTKLLNAVRAEIGQQTKKDETNKNLDDANNTKKNLQSQKLTSGTMASLSALLGVKDVLEDDARKKKRYHDIEVSLLDQGFDEIAAAKGADRAMYWDATKRIAKLLTGFAVGVKTVADIATGAVESGYTDRFSMIAEMRQTGLLAGMKGVESGFIDMSKTISSTNFTFGEATQFTKQFSKAVGVTGVQSALKFANTVASNDVVDGMNYMERYSLEFGQVANIAGEYIDTLRIGGQLRTIEGHQMRAGMEEFMSNVEMTANVLKISMEDAANLMQKALGPDSVALLATLPKEQRDAIEEGFMAVNAQGNPMAETLAKRLAAGSRGAFLQTAEFQQMAGTSVGREVLEFVEQMANQLETGSNQDFQEALAEGFPAFADKLTEMSAQGGVRIQLLNDAQLAQMVGSIIEAAQTYGDAAAGVGAGFDEDNLFVQHLRQQREALVLNEDAMSTHMKDFNDNIARLIAVNKDFATQAALTIATWDGTINFLGEVSTTLQTLKTKGFGFMLDALTSDSFDEPAVQRLLETITMQGGETPLNLYKTGDLGAANTYIDDNRKSLTDTLENLKKAGDSMTDDDKFNESKALQMRTVNLLKSMELVLGVAKQKDMLDEESLKDWKADWEALQAYSETLNAFTTRLEKTITD